MTNYKIAVGSYNSLSNVFLVTMGEIDFGSDNRIGASDFCDTGTGAVHIFAHGKIAMGSNSNYNGVQIVGAKLVELGSNLGNPKGIAVQAGETMTWQSNEDFVGGCRAPVLYLQTGGSVSIVK